MSKQLPSSDILTMEEVADFLGYQNVRSLRNRMYRGKSAPAHIRIPGSRNVFFLRNDVLDFIRTHRVDQS